MAAIARRRDAAPQFVHAAPEPVSGQVRGRLHRVYFDGNEGTEDNLYGLWLPKFAADLARIPGGPEQGMTVTIYSIGEVEMQATLEWNTKWDAWTARPIAGTTRPNAETWEDHKVAS